VARAGLAALVTATPALKVVGRSGAWATLEHDVEEFQPDVLVVQLDTLAQLPAELQALIGTHTTHPLPAVVVLTDRAAGAAEAFHVGLRAVLPRDATQTEIAGAISAAAAGLLAVHPTVFRGPAAVAPSGRDPALTPQPTLTAREVEVLNMLAHGLGNKGIAARLGISEHTVKFHIASVFTKLDASGRAEAVARGIRAGLILL
jgi:DNA-binding NarL/FixJ family response regulator